MMTAIKGASSVWLRCVLFAERVRNAKQAIQANHQC